MELRVFEYRVRYDHKCLERVQVLQLTDWQGIECFHLKQCLEVHISLLKTVLGPSTAWNRDESLHDGGWEWCETGLVISFLQMLIIETHERCSASLEQDMVPLIWLNLFATRVGFATLSSKINYECNW